MTAAVTWYVARAAGLLAWALAASSFIWGLLAAGRLLERRPSPAWLVDLHRHVGNLTLAFTALHVAAILVDGYVDYGLLDVAVPFVHTPDRWAVGLGVVSAWLLVTVQISSWARRRLAPSWWRRLHLLGAPMLVLGLVHGWLVGTDRANPVVVIVGLVLLAETVVLAALRAIYGRRRSPVTSVA